VPPLALTINTDVRTASETLCLSSAAVPGLLSPRVNFLASGGAEAMAPPHRSSDGQVAEKERGRRGGGSSCGPSDACECTRAQLCYPAITPPLKLPLTRARMCVWLKQSSTRPEDECPRHQPTARCAAPSLARAHWPAPFHRVWDSPVNL